MPLLLIFGVALLTPLSGHAASPLQLTLGASQGSRQEVRISGLSSEIMSSLASKDYKYTQNFVVVSTTGTRMGVIDMGGTVSGNTYIVDLIMESPNPNAAVRTMPRGTYHMETAITKMTLPAGSYKYTMTPVATISSEKFSWPSGSTIVSAMPSCELIATPNYVTTAGDTISVAWRTENAAKAKWLKVTPKLKGAKFPSGKAKLSGSKSFTAVAGSPTLTLEVAGKAGTATCSANFTILGKPSPRFQDGTIKNASASTNRPTITGTAPEDKIVYVVVMDEHAEKELWKTKSIPVTNGAWSYTFEKDMADGVHSLSLRDAKNVYMNMGTLVVRTK